MVAPKSQKIRHSCQRAGVLRPLLIFLFLGGILLYRNGNAPSSMELYDTNLFGTDSKAGNTTTTTTTTTFITLSENHQPIIPSNTANQNVVIIKEEELTPKVLPNQTTFAIEYFSSMPECTPLASSDVSFTLTTQLSPDRLWIMKHQCERWPAPLPIAVAIYVPPNAPANEESRILDRLEHELHCDLTRMLITIFRASPGSPIDQYPVNTLRNLALQSITTTHAAYIDSDFLISDGLHDDLLTTTAAVLANDTHAAVVMPAFDYITDCKITTQQEEVLTCLRSEWDMVPKRHEDIVALLEKEKRPRVKVGFQSVRGKNKYHGTTMYKTWLQNQSTAIPIPCVKTWTYEPYLAVRVCRDLPQFPEVFKGWGFNKVIWIKILLKKLGYQLWQVPRGFVMHIPHELSISRKNNMDGHPPEFDTYLDWLGTVPTDPNRLPQCVDWKKDHGPLQPE
jgi:hypothetical protein